MKLKYHVRIWREFSGYGKDANHNNQPIQIANSKISQGGKIANLLGFKLAFWLDKSRVADKSLLLPVCIPTLFMILPIPDTDFAGLRDGFASLLGDDATEAGSFRFWGVRIIVTPVA